MAGRIVVINDFSVARGGATALALLSLELLSRYGKSVTFLSGELSEASLFTDRGVDYVHLGTREAISERHRFKSALKGLFNLTAARALRQWIRQNDEPDTVYHLHGWSKVLSPLIFTALRPVASRTVIHAHDFFLVCPNGAQFNYVTSKPCHLKPLGSECLGTNCDKRSYADKMWRSVREMALYRFTRFSPGFTTILLLHEKMTPYFIEGGIKPEHLRTLRNPVTPFTEKRVCVESNRYACFVGRLVVEKGIYDAAHACRIAGVPLRVIGDGPLRGELMQTFPDVEYTGWRPAAEVRELMKEARMLLMPTHYPEPFGLVALEAAMSGIPVVMSRNALLAEECEALGIGTACDTRNHQELARHIRAFADMAAEEIKAMSMRMTGTSAHCATTPESWRDQLLCCYDATLAKASVLKGAA